MITESGNLTAEWPQPLGQPLHVPSGRFYSATTSVVQNTFSHLAGAASINCSN